MYRGSVRAIGLFAKAATQKGMAKYFVEDFFFAELVSAELLSQGTEFLNYVVLCA